eukprot:scaffold272012_cov15-Tisochrysis_lutea.AAC.1
MAVFLDLIADSLNLKYEFAGNSCTYNVKALGSVFLALNLWVFKSACKKESMGATRFLQPESGGLLEICINAGKHPSTRASTTTCSEDGTFCTS